MNEDFQKYIEFHRNNGGTGKLYNFRLIDYKKGFLKLEGLFPSET